MNNNSPWRYSSEFKRQTAELYLSGSKSIRELSNDLGLAESALHNWVAQYRKHGAQSLKPKELLMMQFKDEFPVTKMAQTFGVSRSAFYRKPGDEDNSDLTNTSKTQY